MRISKLLFVTALGLPSLAVAQNNPAGLPQDPPRPTDPAQPRDPVTRDPSANPTNPTKMNGPMGKLTDADTTILAHIHHVNLMEIDMGKLAQKRGSPAVKRYAEQLVRDHQTSDTSVIAFAKTRGLAKIPDAKPATEAERNDMKTTMDAMAKLKTLKGADFDREYLTMMVDGHDKELVQTEPAMSTASDPELKKLLDGRKVTLQRHADGARELLKSNSQASPSSNSPSPSPTPNSPSAPNQPQQPPRP